MHFGANGQLRQDPIPLTLREVDGLWLTAAMNWMQDPSLWNPILGALEHQIPLLIILLCTTLLSNRVPILLETQGVDVTELCSFRWARLEAFVACLIGDRETRDYNEGE